MATKDLWDKFRAAQKAKNGDAALAYKNAIEQSNKGFEDRATWWEKQGDMAMPAATPQKDSRELTGV